jgi:hypothetical protein
MADDKKPKREIKHSPKGTARYPYLNKPDTKFDADGVFKTDLVLSADDAETVDEVIQETLAEAAEMAKRQAAAAKKKGKKQTPKESDLPRAEVLDDDGEETGEVAFRFKSKASGVSQKTGKRWSRTMPLFDAKGRPSKANIYGGSVIKVAFTAVPWVNPKCEYGVKLQMEGVQIIELVSGGGQKSASALGFGEEDGYVADDEDEEDTVAGDGDEAAADDTDTDDGDDDDF